MCQQSGCPHPNYLGTPRWPLTWDEFQDWMALYELDPWGTHRDDIRGALQVMWLLAPHMKKGKTPPDADRIMPLLNLGGEKKVLTIEEAQQMSDPKRIRKMAQNARW